LSTWAFHQGHPCHELIAAAQKAIDDFTESKCEQELTSEDAKSFKNCERGLTKLAANITSVGKKIAAQEEDLKRFQNPTDEMVKQESGCEEVIPACTRLAKEAFKEKADLLTISLDKSKKLKIEIEQFHREISDAIGSTSKKNEVARKALEDFKKNKNEHIASLQRMRLNLSLGIQSLELDSQTWAIRGMENEAEAQALRQRVKDVFGKQKEHWSEQVAEANARAQACIGWRNEVLQAKNFQDIQRVTANLTTAHTTASATGEAPAKSTN
jgi:hypothetical protein